MNKVVASRPQTSKCTALNVKKWFLTGLYFLIAIVLFQVTLIGTAQAQAELMGMRIGQHADKTRVVFEIKRNLGFKISSLSNPPRIVVDFYKAKNHISFKRKSLKDRFIHRLRVKDQTQTPAKRTRVVLDLHHSEKYHYFSLGKNARGNERVVIDIFPKESYKPKKQKKSSQSVWAKRVKRPSKPTKSALKVAVKSQTVQTKKSKVETRAQKIASNKTVSKSSSKVVLASRHPKHQVSSFDSETQKLLKRFTQVPLKDKKTLVVAIDPGHGGKDTGAIGATGLYEKNITLALAKKLKRYIDAQPGMRAVLTRNSDIFIPLHKRVEIAHRKDADIFISIHADSYPSKKVRGGSVYVLSTKGASSVMARLLAKSENASLKGLTLLSEKDQDVAFALSDLAREANIRASRKLAQKVLFEMQKTVVVHKHQVQSADFAVLKSIDMPSLLIEAAFISNPHEEKNLVNAHFQSKMAKSIVRGLKRFVKQRAVQPSWGETMFVHYRVQKGDTLSEIAAKYKLPVRELKRINHLHNANQIYVGKKLRIPITAKLVAGL